ncbi:MBL fold metallo-hydrolase [bacterium (Candidatus Blackallbacteria) CG17_big_fil_post_rev_8_21_14_2_50_48_46]|uniref:MBL fold metallo-hydrolase n=1 Tax=bacterium (Candidatus Blackallbacteria) CG17_big_fil_post_rev_8_21_14_2_50_48_46 TaxID=2014261 RepID=A0A2M7FYW0_9BACT|nr:MAG: MBL fold metallo-hydrolase [bacterium (Candidatus Blackallbacteria) CG18_big_fil_WC_8_21_14_2_50_49_26]PIW14280.1 MAG: MBL fold metallo-hydrolase [bacterium (Candidatus Blackallbacteria) CG17_big_fil_post_rev_8_21_14_2_50_48_46]PIW45549.1 MAG: MBL fold metallo-hydrolase [bacterium (Candidatus Blackallbacteria) CG13_big_fil_rev_8_21_14_2_50_49_14]
MSLAIATFPVGLLQCNCSIVSDPETREALIIDPGGDAPKILDYLKENQLKARYLLHTHAHFDHVGATRELKETLGAEILLHPEDLFLYDQVPMQGALFGLQLEATTPTDRPLEDEMEICFGKQTTRILHTPGHTPGSVCFHFEGHESHLFSGDTLFKGGIGRTDLWGGSQETLMRSIHRRLLCLDESTQIYPGHGPQSTLWHEKKQNPFLV